MPIPLAVAPHPALDPGAFVTVFAAPLGDVATPASWIERMRLDAEAPLVSDDDVRKAVRNCLRHHGYKPTGRGKPASEYLIRAAGESALASINPAVDACNVVSLHSGLPISVIDLDRAAPPLSIAVAEPGAEYVFNPAGQVIRIGGLPCICDAAGPCANAVKDAQRTKTDAATTRTLSVVWGTRDLPGRAARAVEWYREILESLGATTEPVAVVES